MKIGFIGLGIMGESMCENIVKKHDDTVYVFDFVKEKVEHPKVRLPVQTVWSWLRNQTSSFPWFRNQSIPGPCILRSLEY